MQILVEARANLDACYQAVDSPLAKLDVECRSLISRTRSLTTRVSAATTKLEEAVSDMTKAFSVERTRQRPSSVSAQALQAALTQAEAEQRRVGALVHSTKQGVQGLQAAIDAAVQPLEEALTSLANTRATARTIHDTGATKISAANAAIDSLRKTLADSVQRVEDTVVGNLQTVQQTTNTFVEQIRGIVRGFASMLDGAISPAETGAATLGTLVTDVTSKAEELISGLESIVSLTLGVIDKIPVAALPSAMAKPAIDALTQATTQFATQLQTGAQTASAQLGTVADQISSTIDQTQTQLIQTLQTALQPVFDQIDQVLQQIDAKQTEIENGIQASLQSVLTQKDQLVTQAKTQVAAITGPLTAQMQTLTAQLESTSASVQSAVATVTSSATAALNQLEARTRDTETQIAALATRVRNLTTTMTAQLRAL